LRRTINLPSRGCGSLSLSDFCSVTHCTPYTRANTSVSSTRTGAVVIRAEPRHHHIFLCLFNTNVCRQQRQRLFSSLTPSNPPSSLSHPNVSSYSAQHHRLRSPQSPSPSHLESTPLTALHLHNPSPMMANKYDDPPAYGSPPPQPPPQAYYHNQGPSQPYPDQYGPPPGQQGYYQPGPQMGYYQQQQQPYPQQGGYYPAQQPQGYYQDDRRGGGPGLMEACLASLACCCCLELCLF